MFKEEETKQPQELLDLDSIPLIKPDLQRTTSQAIRMNKINRQFSHHQNSQNLLFQQEQNGLFKNIMKKEDTQDLFEFTQQDMQLSLKKIFSNCSYNNEPIQTSFPEIVHENSSMTLQRQDTFQKVDSYNNIEVPVCTKNVSQKNFQAGFTTINQKKIFQQTVRVSKEKAEQQITKQEQKKHLLYNLQNLLKQFFCSQDISISYTQLSQIEKKILKSILRKKFSQEVDIDNLKDMQLKYKLNLILKESKQTYRPEERNKLIFKKALKLMREDMRDSLKKQKTGRIKKEVLDKEFLKNFFQETSLKEKIDLEYFRPPTNNKNPTLARTINNDYLSLVKKSRKFVNDMFKKLDNELLLQYQKEIEQKIDGLMDRWKQQLEEVEDSQIQQNVLTEICHYIETKRECKLPWSIKDFENSVVSFKEFFK